jgi:hypothetical protein
LQKTKKTHIFGSTPPKTVLTNKILRGRCDLERILNFSSKNSVLFIKVSFYFVFVDDKIALLILKYRNSDSLKLKRHFRFVFILKNRYFRNCHFKDRVICAKINKKTPTLDCYSRLQRGALFNAK